jgi:pimeloyl-ACP methyl ester carboxylesterase
MNGETQGNYVSVNGLEMYYEDRGAGQPLVLLHGAFSAIGEFLDAPMPEAERTAGGGA